MSAGVDVVSLPRIARMLRRDGDALADRLLHPGDRSTPAGLRAEVYLGLALAAKEAWIKARGGRPDGWEFATTRVRVADAAGVPEPVVHQGQTFAADLGVDSLTYARLDTPVQTGTDQAWACAGVRNDWLIAGVLS